MCAIIGWAGKMPVGLLTNLFLASEHRGRDSSGIAFRQENMNVVVKEAISPAAFVKHHQSYLKEARLSSLGIGHTRRASRNMPVDNFNAHPFVYENYIFAHNGVVRNWKDVKNDQFKNFMQRLGAQNASEKQSLERKLGYTEKITTDSMVLGECIENLDFRPVSGCFGLIWLHRGNLYAARAAKELTSAALEWKTNSDKLVNKVTIVSSTREIITEALSKLKNIEFSAKEFLLKEESLYGIQPSGPTYEGTIAVTHDTLSKDLITSKKD